MKMITAIINRKDGNRVCNELTKANFVFTKIATSGGFLKQGNVTVLMGVDDALVDSAVKIIRDNSAMREERVPSVTFDETHSAAYAVSGVMVGGATVFVSDVVYYDKF